MDGYTIAELTDDSTPEPLKWLDMSAWDHAPTPERKWAIKDRVPLNQAGLFSGEGGTGKSIIELMKNVAHVAGKDWLGAMPEPGPAFYLGAEDDADEIHIRLTAIAKHYGVTFKQLIDGGLRVLPLLGQDATLCAANGKSGKVEVTGLYKQLYEAAGDIKPINISIDTLSRAFAGSELDRVQVYAFAMHMQALAMVAGGSVTVLSHPSLTGIASGSGISGSTAWHGAFRFRQYLTSARPGDGEQPDNNLRQFEFKKNQYGPIGETVTLRYQRGLFLPLGGLSSLDKLAREAMVDDVFLVIAKKLEGRGQELSPAQTSHSYGPTIIARQPEAKGIKKAELVDALDRLLEQGKLRIETRNPGTTREKKVILACGSSQ
jgi:RecA-family ATPase